MANITISDIAREAGVSKATVSRVLNNPSIVDAEKKEKVQKIIDKYHFRPSALARNMSVQRTPSIGVLVPELDNPFFSNILRGALNVLEKNNYTIVCFNSDEIAERDIKALRDMISYRYSGLLYTPIQEYYRVPEKTEIEHLLKALDVPIVIMDRNFAELRQYDSIYFDDRGGIIESVQRLAQAGHRKIGLLNAQPSYFLARIRLEGYLTGLKTCGIPYEEKYHYVLHDYSMDEAYEKTCELLASPDRPTAMITGNNSITLGFLKALRQFGMEVSKDIACIGLDRIEALDIIGTNLNYIKRDGVLMGRTAAEMVLRRIADPSLEAASVALDHEIVIRQL